MMITLEQDDLQWILRRTPKDILKLLKNTPKLIMASGCIRSIIANEKVNDIDLFYNNSEEAKKLAQSLGPTFETGNASSVKFNGVQVQFIHRWTYDSPKELMESFDFTIAQAAIWYGPMAGTWLSICSDQFYSDLAAKRLRYLSPIRNEDAGGSILRVLKFYQRGYRIPLEDLAKVIARLNSGVKNIGDMDEPGMAKIISGLLREVDPNIDPSHIAHLPSSLSERELEEKV
jgi:hypothetical protein